MNEQAPNLGYGSEDEIADESGTVDVSIESEGVGGIPDLKPEERATVSDVDGDNVEEDRPTSKS